MSGMVQRWRLTGSHNIYGEHRIVEDADDAGEWVKYYDFRSSLSQALARIEELEKAMEELRAALTAAKYVPGDCPVVPVKIDAFMKTAAALLPTHPHEGDSA